MAVKASDQVTIAVGVDVASVETYYKLQLSTATPPSKPITADPSDWTNTEPTYDGTATNTLYTCQKTTLTDNSFLWGAVSKSSSYEAAKSAWNLATSANNAVNATRSWYATCETAAATAVKVATITPETTAFELRVGVIVNVEFTATNSAKVSTLKLNVNSTGEKSIKYMYNNARNDIPAVGYLVAGIVYQFMYDGDYWTIQNMHYNTNTTYNLSQNLYSNTIKAKSAIVAETIIVGDANGYAQVQSGVTFDISYPILWCTKAIAVNGTNSANLFTSVQDRNLKTNYSSFQGTANAMVYLVGTVSGNTFTIDSNALTSTEPTTEDGKIYIPIGRHGNQYVYASAPAYFFFDCQMTILFAYVDGAFRQVNASTVIATHRIYYRTETANSSLTAPTTWVAEATGNVYNQWTTKVPPLAASTATGQTKYLYLYTCEQRKRLDGTTLCTKVLLDENTTVIDGGSIITNSVTANQIAAGAITADQIQGGSLTIGLFGASAQADILNSNVVVPSKVSELANDSNFATIELVNNGIETGTEDLYDQLTNISTDLYGSATIDSDGNIDDSSRTNGIFATVASLNELSDSVSGMEDSISNATSTLNDRIDEADETVNDIHEALYGTDSTSPIFATSEEVSNGYADLTDSMTTLEGSLRDNISNSVNGVESRIINRYDSTKTELDKLRGYIRVDVDDNEVPYLELGQVGNEVTVHMTNSTLDFKTSNEADPVASIGSDDDGGLLKVTRANIGQLDIGEHSQGHWEWQQRANGNLALKWIAAQS